MKRIISKLIKILPDYIGILLGVAITAFGLSWFLIPGRIAAGGVSGLAIVTFHLLELPVGLTMLVLNIPLFLASLKIIGTLFGVKTLFGAITISILVDLFSRWAVPITSDPLLASIYGGVIVGVGLGIAFRYGGSTGGTDMAAQLLARYFPTSVGQALLIVDGFVIALAGFVFGPELALYALLAVFITTKSIDLVQEGQSYAKAAFIISSDPISIGKEILHKLDRGATALEGKGMFTGSHREVLFVIVSRQEISQLKDIVHQVDNRAFLVITDVHEVLGEGFTRV